MRTFDVDDEVLENKYGFPVSFENRLFQLNCKAHLDFREWKMSAVQTSLALLPFALPRRWSVCESRVPRPQSLDRPLPWVWWTWLHVWGGSKKPTLKEQPLVTTTHPWARALTVRARCPSCAYSNVKHMYLTFPGCVQERHRAEAIFGLWRSEDRLCIWAARQVLLWLPLLLCYLGLPVAHKADFISWQNTHEIYPVCFVPAVIEHVFSMH